MIKRLWVQILSHPNILDGNGVKTMPGLISALNSGSLEKNMKNKGSQMVHTQKNIYHDMMTKSVDGMNV